MTNLLKLGDLSPQISPKAWVGETAVIVGDVRLADHVGVWYGAVLRGDNEPLIVGKNTNIQEHAMFHTDIGFPLVVGENCTIGHRALLHGCEIGDNTLIGMGAMVMNGAKIGKNCLIGAGTIVTEGKVIPDGSMVIGIPGRIKRELSDEEIERNRKSARHYVENMQRFKATAQPI